MQYHPLSLAIILSLSVNTVMAQQVLPTTTITEADKQKSAVSHRVGESEGAQLISDVYVKAQQASTLADALRKTTSVQIDEEGGQQGSLIFIRGFTQDQVSVRVEGAPKNFNQVRHGGAGTVWLEPNMYKSINVIPGVASNVYGNGSLGGVILLETKDPIDVFKPGEDWGASITAGLETNAESKNIAIDLAKQVTNNFALSSTLVVRDTEQYEDGEGKKALLGATGSEDQNLLLKGVLDLNDEQRLELAYIGLRKEYTARTTTGSGAYTSPSDTEVDDNTYTLQYNFTPTNNPYVDVNLRLSQANTKRWRLKEGEAIPAIWQVDTSYFEAENISLFSQSEAINHELRFGVDYTYDDVNTAYTNSDGSAQTAERTQYGAYLSDTINFSEQLQLVASVRFDNFENDFQDAPATSESAVSPKLAINWRPFNESLMRGLEFYGVIGQGFRAPSVHEARADDEPNCGRRGCSARIDNPDLKGESSNSWELGLRFSQSQIFTDNDQLDWQIGYIDNQAEDYISSTEVDSYKEDIDGDGKDETVIVYQYQNVDKANISGIEISMNYTNDHWFAAVTAQNIDGEYASGKYEGTKLPNISPASANVSFGGYFLDGKSRAGIDISHRSSREFVQRSRDRTRQSYTIYDAFASYQINSQWLLQLRVENLMDELYSKRTIVNIDGEDATTYAAGRNVKLNFSYQF